MDKLIFSQAAIFHLQQLANHLHRQTGIRYKLSTTEGILSLLSAGGNAHMPHIRKCYDAFVMELNKRQLDALAAQGIRLRTPAADAAQKLG